MKALVYSQFGSPDVLEWVSDWPDPELPEQGVLVETVAGSVNPKDALLRKGKFSRTLARDPLPRAAGLDVSGRVVAVGSGVRDFAEGDLVFGMTNRFSGGVHVEVACFHQDEIERAPANLSLESAAAIPLAAQTALQGLRDYGQARTGQRVLINGASGGVGHFAVQIARVLGLEVHAVCGSRNVSIVESLGADTVYDYHRLPATEIEAQFDLVFDVFGKLNRSLFTNQIRPRGIYVTTVPKLASLRGELLALTGLARYNRLVQVKSRSSDLRQLREWAEQDRLRPHIMRTYPVEQAQEAHQQIESRHTTGKVCLTFQPE